MSVSVSFCFCTAGQCDENASSRAKKHNGCSPTGIKPLGTVVYITSFQLLIFEDKSITQRGAKRDDTRACFVSVRTQASTPRCVEKKKKKKREVPYRYHPETDPECLSAHRRLNTPAHSTCVGMTLIESRAILSGLYGCQFQRLTKDPP